VTVDSADLSDVSAIQQPVWLQKADADCSLNSILNGLILVDRFLSAAQLEASSNLSGLRSLHEVTGALSGLPGRTFTLSKVPVCPKSYALVLHHLVG